MRVVVLLLLCAGFAIGQSPAAPTAPATGTGVNSEWDSRQMLAALQARARQLASMLEQLKPAEWVKNGAPQQYVAQVTAARNEVNYLLGSAQQLSTDPEKLPAALETLFRMQALDSTLRSVIEGMRKYGNPAVADLVQAMANENDQNRDRLKQYVVDLATDKEHELKVMDAEAQRCRATVSGSSQRQHSSTRQK